jgi:hypothetical protein
MHESITQHNFMATIHMHTVVDPGSQASKQSVPLSSFILQMQVKAQAVLDIDLSTVYAHFE